MALTKFRKFWSGLALLSLLLCAGMGNAQDAWRSGLYQDHELVGKIWHSASGEFISSAKLLATVEQTRYLLIGEKHDNPDHHQMQLRLIEYLLERRRMAVLAIEMLESDKQPLLLAIGPDNYQDLDSLKDYLQWDEEGWDWDFYSPLLLATLKADIPVAAANITSTTMQTVYGQAQDELISGVLDAKVVAQLQQDIDESHCGLLPESQFPAMVRVQQARDRQMASSLMSNGIAAAGVSGVSVLVAGNYHIRQDLGVPNYLLAQDEGLSRSAIMSLALLEVAPDIEDPADYLQAFVDIVAYDYIWFTPAVSNEDYCASLRQ